MFSSISLQTVILEIFLDKPFSSVLRQSCEFVPCSGVMTSLLLPPPEYLRFTREEAFTQQLGCLSSLLMYRTQADAVIAFCISASSLPHQPPYARAQALQRAGKYKCHSGSGKVTRKLRARHS